MANFSGKAFSLSFFSKIEKINFMIHNSSKAPVLIKKISINLWSLRDEIEARIHEEITQTGSEEVDLIKIKNQYSKSAVNNVVELKTGTDLDNSEDEMARAMRGEEPAAEDSAPTEVKSDEENSTNIVSINQNQIEVTLSPPPIPSEKIHKGKTILSEITMDKMFLFTNKFFTEGQSVVIQFCIPKTFILNADVLYCRPYNLKSKIISENNFAYRVMLRFTFLKDGERALLRQFLQSVEPDFQAEVKPQQAEKEAESGFDELDDLGL